MLLLLCFVLGFFYLFWGGNCFLFIFIRVCVCVCVCVCDVFVLFCFVFWGAFLGVCILLVDFLWGVLWGFFLFVCCFVLFLLGFL